MAGWRGGDPVLAALAALGGFILLFYGLDAGGTTAQTVACWLILVALQAADVRIALAISRAPGSHPGPRRYWRMFAFSIAALWVGSLWELGRSIITPQDAVQGSSAVQLATLGMGGLGLIAAMLTFPLAVVGGRERRRLWLDTATVMVAAVIFAWYLGGPASHGGPPSWADLARGLLGPGVFVVLGFGVLKLTMSRTPPFTPVGALFGAGAGILEAMSTGLDHALVASGHLSWSTSLGLLANVTLTMGLRIQHRVVQAQPARLQSRPPVAFSRLPYTAIAATYGLLVFELARHGLTTRAWAVLGAALVSTALVVLRQLAAFADNAALVARLDAKVDELAQAHAAVTAALAERDELSRELQHQATHDALTGLANRALLMERGGQCLARTRRSGHPTGLLMVDLDDFKPVNDRYGHRAGDELLAEVARRMLATVREVDTVARLGGDEFAVLVEPGSDVTRLAERLAEVIARPITLTEGEVVVGASIGSALADGTDADLEEVLARADQAMYAAKRSAKESARQMLGAS